jgi:glycosyltransferase involved in cell wall biosynthesis
MNARPFLSIITPCLNRAAFIEDAIQSVLDQDFSSFEHIVVDGGSSDGTPQILQAHSHLTVIPGPDTGMYQAINKGIARARGEAIGLLNSDDMYADRVFADLKAGFDATPAIQALVGGADVSRSFGPERQVLRQHAWIEENDLWLRATLGPLVSNAWFFRRSLFEQIGCFDDRFQFSADREFLFRMAAAQVAFRPLRRTVYHYREHAGALTFNPTSSRDARRAGTRIAMLHEGALVTEMYLDRAGLPPEAVRGLRALHNDRTYRHAATALYHRNWRSALSAARAGWRYDPLWPLVFVRRLLGRLVPSGRRI